MNGIATGADLPRDGAFIRVLTSTYDPSKGGFSGVRSNYVVTSSLYKSDRMLHASLDAPALQWTTPTADRLGRRYTLPIVSGSFSGPVGDGNGWLRFQHTSFQASRRSSDLITLATASPASLAAIGVAPDSAAQLLATLNRLGVDADRIDIPSTRVRARASLYTRLDFSVSDFNTFLEHPDGLSLYQTPRLSLDGTKHPDFYILAGGTWTDDQALNTGATSLPLHGGNARGVTATIQANGATEIGPTVNEFSSALNVRRDRTSPYAMLPAASVRLRSSLPDGTAAFTTLQVAGNTTGPSESATWSWETIDKIRWKTFDGRHEFQVSLDGSLDHYTTSRTPGLGAYVYNSLSEFSAEQASSFSRTFEAVRSSGMGARAAVGLSDISSPFASPNLTTQYSVRIEGNHFFARPAFNPLTESTFGLRTDRVPNAVTVSPMAGFTWNYATLPNGRVDARRSVAGGFRDWRGVLATQALDPYLRHTGLALGDADVRCVGDAVPSPDWVAFGASPDAVPETCADGSIGSPLSDVSPIVSVFAPNYSASHSMRGDLTWTSMMGSHVSISLHGMGAINTKMPGLVDANFSGRERFTLTEEGGRSVYVASSSIVAATGSVAASDSRTSSQFGQIGERLSDGRARTGLLTAQIGYRPTYNRGSAAPSMPLNIAYTYAETRRLTNGFTGTTDDDPRLNVWSAGAASRHTVIVSGMLRVPTWLTLAAAVRVQSGRAYTPLVSADINGDGYANDRAFVFDPSRVSDAAVGTTMRTLLASAPASTRRCLRRQLGTIAGMNSCVGPWSATLNLRAGFDAYRVGFGNRGTISLVLNNALGAADQLVHGASHLHGWGQPAFPEQTLLDVRGFDPARQRFVYDVNPSFGSTANTRANCLAPFSVTLDARFTLGPDGERIRANSLARGLASNGQPDEDAAKRLLMRAGRVSKPFGGLFGERTKLELTSAQFDLLSASQDRYLAEREALYGQLTAYLAAQNGRYDADAVERHWHDVLSAVARAQWALGQGMRRTLSAAQLRQANDLRLFGPDAGYLLYDRGMLDHALKGRLILPP